MNTESAIAKGNIERIGEKGSFLTHKYNNSETVIKKSLKTHTDAFSLVLEALTDKEIGVIEKISEIEAVGHRILHGGDYFKKSVLITAESKSIMEKNIPLGPLHMPANMACVDSCIKLMPNVPQVAVFDTSFHQTMPEKAFMYAIPYTLYEEKNVRRYGFHGTSHKYVSSEALRYLNNNNAKVITCHLGNGASISAVAQGECKDTSMGLTPLEGLIMGTRCGDIDVAVITYIAEIIKEEKIKNNIAQDKIDVTMEEIINYLNKKCGLLGISGGISDARDLEALARGEGVDASNAEDIIKKKRAQLALDMFAYRVKKYIGSYAAILGGLDCIAFTGGIGENASTARERILKGLDFFKIKLNKEKNDNAARGQIVDISADDSEVKILIIPTNEELVIARDTKELCDC